MHGNPFSCEVKYNLKRSKRAKRMRIAVFCDGRVDVTVPIFIKDNIVDEFITQKKNWILDKVNNFLQYPQKMVVVRTKRDFKKYKDEVLNLVINRLKHFNQFYNYKYNRVSVKNQKSRWGSCSRKGNLNFNYKILFLSEEARDYIIVHELCHIEEFNHSKNFWDLVEKTIPNLIEIRKSLKIFS